MLEDLRKFLRHTPSPWDGSGTVLVVLLSTCATIEVALFGIFFLNDGAP